jgi:hypothetical protein
MPGDVGAGVASPKKKAAGVSAGGPFAFYPGAYLRAV